MKKYFILITLLFLFACKPAKVILLSDNYPETPIQFTTNKDFNEVWDKLVDLFAQKGLSIRIIDRSSGLIVSGRSLLTTTIEDKNSQLIDSNAFIAVPKIYNKYFKRYVPITKTITGAYMSKNLIDKSDPVYGEWNVRIKKNESGTSVNVNIVNLTYQALEKKVQKEKTLSVYKSTGVFEKIISDIVTH